jgi:light-regulated signal transduction histidine kinase (bacteriophytochrome)
MPSWSPPVHHLEQFVSMATHGLQEPLRSISAFADLLQRKEQLSEEGQTYLDFIRTGAGRMKELISDLLAYTAPRPTHCGCPRRFHGAKRFGRQSANCSMVIREKEARIVCGPLPVLAGNRLQLKQVLQNLIGNALKYSGERPPEIHISAKRHEGDWIFCVRDNGIGLDMKYAELIFEPLKRLHGKEEIPGTGIGLAICKRVIERHGGRIWVESQPGQGSTFYFSLPDVTRIGRSRLTSP